MKTIIIIKSQAELDALPEKFDEMTYIEIRSDKDIDIVVSRSYNSASVYAYGSASVYASDSASVYASDSASVYAYDSASVYAYGSASVYAHDSASVTAYDSASVYASDSASVTAYDSASVYAYGSASVYAYGSASVELYMSAYVIVLSSYVTVKKLLDYSISVFKGCSIKIEEKADTAMATEAPQNIEVTYEEWLRRGHIYADGILRKIKSQKKIGDIEVFECDDFDSSFVVKRGETFSHGKTLEKAIEDLRYKISNRDMSEFESWKGNLDMEITLDDAIAAYRVITGACEYGVKEFVESIKVPEKLTPREVIELTDGKYGSETFRKFVGE